MQQRGFSLSYNVNLVIYLMESSGGKGGKDELAVAEKRTVAVCFLRFGNINYMTSLDIVRSKSKVNIKNYCVLHATALWRDSRNLRVR